MQPLLICLNSFNSILVRLKEEEDILVNVVFNKFQFHTGSIKSLSKTYLWEPFAAFQFHTGSIKS